MKYRIAIGLVTFPLLLIPTASLYAGVCNAKNSCPSTETLRDKAHFLYAYSTSTENFWIGVTSPFDDNGYTWGMQFGFYTTGKIDATEAVIQAQKTFEASPLLRKPIYVKENKDTYTCYYTPPGAQYYITVESPPALGIK